MPAIHYVRTITKKGAKTQKNTNNVFEVCIRKSVLQSLRSRESQLDEKGNVFSTDAE